MSVFAIVWVVATLVGTAGLGGLLKTWLDHKRGRRAQTDHVALALVETLEKRVEKLETDLKEERRLCDDRLDRLEAEQEAELRLLRHLDRGRRQIIYSLLHLFDLPASRRKPMLARIRDELATLEANEAVEKGAFLGAKVAGAGE